MSSSYVANIRNLFAGLQRVDPQSYEGLMQILYYLEKQEALLFPIIQEFSNPVSNTPADPNNFTYTILPTGILFTWGQPSGSFPLYEIRKGTDWDTADFVVRTTSLSALISPLVSGNYTYLLRSLGSSGIYGETILSINFTITGPSAVALTSNVIDNNVLLYWVQPSTQFAIDYYVILNGSQQVGTVRSTFMPVSLVASGTYTFYVYAVDIAGNTGLSGSVTVQVSQPPDYVLQDNFTSNLVGTRNNCYRFS
jgi:predicted phage tail protein